VNSIFVFSTCFLYSSDLSKLDDKSLRVISNYIQDIGVETRRQKFKEKNRDKIN